jgi:hypothetical protein
MKDFPIKEKLQAIPVHTSTYITPTFFAIQANHLCTYSLKKDTMVDMFSLPDLIHKKSFGVRGQGPSEFQSFPWPCKSTNECFYVRGYKPLIVRQLEISSALDMKPVREFALKNYESFGPMHIVQDSLLIYLSMGNQDGRKEQISIKKYNLNQGKEVGEISVSTSVPENASLDPNRVGGFDVNDSFIVYAYLFKKQIDIYDVQSMKLVCQLKIDKNREPRINKDFTKNIPHYQCVAIGKECFYALYNKKGCVMGALEPTSQTIEVFDYSGKAIAEYSLDNYINVFALDEAHGSLYAYDITKEDYILKYNLPKINTDTLAEQHL